MADLCVWDRCNNKCLMCTNPDRPWPAWDGGLEYGLEQIIGRLERFKERVQADGILYLTGGEPTIHPQFPEIMGFLVKNFPSVRIVLLTNGRSFIYEKFAQSLLGLVPNLEINVSLCGPNPAIHNAVTRSPGSFEQAVAGLKNLIKLKKPGQAIGIRTVAHKISCPHISQTLKTILKEFPEIDNVVVLFPEFEEQAIKNIKQVGITHVQARPHIEKTFPLLKKFKDIRFYHFPLCSLDKKFWPYIWRTLPEKEISFDGKCEHCRAKDLCLGIHRGYRDNFGTEGLEPVKDMPEIIISSNPQKPVGEIV